MGVDPRNRDRFAHIGSAFKGKRKDVRSRIGKASELDEIWSCGPDEPMGKLLFVKSI